ncbi:MAG: hypothetical protein ACD_86C00001G0008 [uncultured bacterium]|nr:MAG: hypothetical protein ACD_86C00001G0008 [uncultured bacterium]
METVKIELSKTVSEGGKNVRKPTGVSLEVPVYTIAELVEHSPAAAQWAQDAIQSACLARARNAGEQSAVHSTIDELITKAERSGEALKLHAEFCKAFALFLSTAAADKKQAVRDVLVGMSRSKSVLATSNETRKAALANYLQEYIESAVDAEVAKFGHIVSGLVDACNGESVDDADFE